MTLVILGRITEEQFLEVRQGPGDKTHHQTKVKKKDQILYKRTHYLMSALVTPENIFFSQCAGLTTFFFILPEGVFPLLTRIQRALPGEEQLLQGPGAAGGAGMGAGERTWRSDLEKWSPTPSAQSTSRPEI